MRKYYSMTSGGDSGKGAEIEQEFKELNKYLDALCTNGHEVKDCGHLWIAFTDKFNAFRKRVLALEASQTTPPKEGVEQAAANYAQLQCGDPAKFTTNREGVDYNDTIESFLAGATWQAGQDRGEAVISFCEKQRKAIKISHSESDSMYADGKKDGQSVAYQNVIEFLQSKSK